MTLDGIYGMFKQEGRSLTFTTRAAQVRGGRWRRLA
jgi:hypothetical protein